MFTTTTMLNSPTLIYSTATALIGIWIIRLFIRSANDPLRRIPGPWQYHSPLSVPYSIYRALDGSLLTLPQNLQERHTVYKSPLIRMGGNAVSLLSLDGFATIHGMRGPFFRKAREHAMATFGGAANLFSLRDRAVHAARRRLFARAFSSASLRENWGDQVKEKAAMAVELIREQAVGKSHADVYRLWKMMTADVLSLLAFGETLGLMEQEAEGGKGTGREKAGESPDAFIKAMDDWATKIMLKIVVPSSIRSLFYLITPFWPRLDEIERSEDIIREKGSAAVDVLRRARESGSAQKQSLFTNALLASETDDAEDTLPSSNDSEKPAPATLTDADIISEASILLFAGTDTTSTTLTYLTWAVLSRPSLQARLEAEAALLPPNFTDADVASTCPLLEACLKETLRLYGPANAPLPRMVPREGVTLEGTFLPGGTKVFTTAWTMHRLVAVFPDPETFDPARWDEANVTEEMRRAWVPFGTGARSCVGVHLAWMEMRLAGALFFRECRGARMVGGGERDAEMEQVMLFVETPKGGRCEIEMGR